MTSRIYHIFRAIFVLVAIIIVVPAVAQNTKGDRPVDNQRKIRENKGKTVKKKSKASTKDIAGRRLRTKNKSSANRANVGIPQPATTSKRPSRVSDRAARAPISNRFTSRVRRNSDPDRSWQGDISGYKPRKIKAKSSEETGRNVYPQPVFTKRQPNGKSPFDNKGRSVKSASGRVITKRTPQRVERAWKGDIKGQPMAPPPSRTGSVSNVYRQQTRYSKYVSKRPSGKDKPYNNRGDVARAARFGTDAKPKNWGNRSVVSVTGQAPYVTRGRKNVYWGKMKRRENASTRDLAGRPLQKKNFRSAGIGLTGTDSLKFFGRKPHGDAMSKGRLRNGKFVPGSEAKGGWLNDIAGYRLRKKNPGGAEQVGSHEYSGFRSVSGKFRNNRPVQTKAPGLGAAAVANGLRRTKGVNGQNFGDQGAGFTGIYKQKRQGKFTGSKTGGLWNNDRTPIQGKLLPASAGIAGRFSGRIKGTGVREFSDQGAGFSGYLKARKPYKFTGSKSGKGWNNDGTPVQGKLLPGGAERAGLFSGRIKGDAQRNFSDQGGTFTGFLKAKKPYKFTGNSPNRLWNNNGKAITELEATRGAAAAGSFQGRKKIREPEKTKIMSTPNKLWNNNEKSVTQLETTRAAASAGYFQGRKKTREPEKGKIMSSPNVLWNNDEKATTVIKGTKAGLNAGLYQGRLKAKQPKEYALNTNRKSWNNEGKATTQITLTTVSASAGKYQGNVKYKKANKEHDDNIQARMKMKLDYTQNPHSVEEATKKQKPQLNYKAGNFASGVKVVGKRKHNPNSADDALDGLYHSKASARTVDYQGNVKMKKFRDRRESPDAKFVHQGENNVKEDRTIVTNMKLLWSKLFQKSESQPANLKNRGGKMRYDKREKGLWAD